MNLAFSGKLGSGKSTLSKMVSQNLGLGWHSFGTTLKQITIDSGVDPTRENLQKLGESMISNSLEKLCERVLQDARKVQDSKFVVLDGVRHIGVLSYLRNHSGEPFFFVHVDVNDDVRLARVHRRDGVDRDTLEIWDAHSTEKDVHEALRRAADLVVDNSGEPEYAVDHILRAVSKHY